MMNSGCDAPVKWIWKVFIAAWKNIHMLDDLIKAVINSPYEGKGSKNEFIWQVYSKTETDIVKRLRTSFS